MDAADPLVYRDRASGELRHERVYAARLLDWMYNTRSGGWAETLLCGGAWASRVYGWWQRRPSSRRRIRPFARRLGIDVSECLRPLDEFASLAEFFTREIDLTRRPLDPDPLACLSPVDGKVLVEPRVTAGQTLRIKRALFDLERLVGDARLARAYDGGAAAVCRLSLADYHHVHFPTGGVPDAAVELHGRYHAGGPYARRRLVPFFGENRRARTSFASDVFGELLLIEVGAFTVGSIRQGFTPGKRVERGARKACFELGGSTVVLLFRPGTIVFDDDLRAWSARGIETYVRLGDTLGRRGPDASGRPA